MSRAPTVKQLARWTSAANAAGERPFGTIERYWNDPAYRAELDAERVREQAKLNAMIDDNIRRARERREMAKQHLFGGSNERG